MSTTTTAEQKLAIFTESELKKIDALLTRLDSLCILLDAMNSGSVDSFAVHSILKPIDVELATICDDLTGRIESAKAEAAR